MNSQPTPRRRETFLVLFLALALACSAALVVLMILGRFFLAMLAVAAGLIVLGFLQYLIWGMSKQRSATPARRETGDSR